MDEAIRTELEAAAFPTCKIFCRNCLSNCYQETAAAKGVSLSKEEAREIIYGMRYETWKAMFHWEIPAKRAGG